MHQNARKRTNVRTIFKKILGGGPPQTPSCRTCPFCPTHFLVPSGAYGHIPFVHSILERGRKFIFFGEVTPYASGYWCNSKIKSSKVKIIGNKHGEFEASCIYSSEIEWFLSTACCCT